MSPHDRRAVEGVMDRVGDSKGYRVAHPRPQSSREPRTRRSSVKVIPVFSIHQSDFSFKRTIGFMFEKSNNFSGTKFGATHHGVMPRS